jgi:hypothetical protein
MRRVHRLAFLATLLAAAPVLAGCENFDMDKLDIFHLNEKKKLPGERHELFPGGVPGVTQGVPPEYMKGYQPPQENADVLPPASKVNPGDENADAALKPAAQTAAIAPVEKPKVRRKPKPKPAQVTIRPAAPAPAPWPATPTQAQQQQQQAQSPWPAAPGQAQQPQAQAPWPDPKPPATGSPWPAAPPPGNFSH